LKSVVRLRHADCSGPGIARVRRGRGFGYRDASGVHLDDSPTLDRIRALAIPPAWEGVWICSDPRGHLQATGIDAAGRKQYLYHPVWREQRDQEKFRDMEAFSKNLPRLRRHVGEALRTSDEPTRERVAAGAVRLLDIGLFRVGSEQYADDSGGVGLATLTAEHLRVSGGEAKFDYLGKSGVRRVLTISDPDSVALLRSLRGRRGGPAELLAYRERRRWHQLGSDAINHYIKQAAGDAFSAKDFRTWNATAFAAARLAAFAQSPVQRSRQRVVGRVIGEVAEMLGNTPAVARRAYVDPRVVDAYLSGSTIDIAVEGVSSLAGLGERRRRRVELAVLDLLAA
jgi:DNA topoisomerase-1